METSTRPRENWFDPEYVRFWLGQQAGRTDERLRHFHMIRSLVPYQSNQPFRALDVGGGDGWLAEVLLSRFTTARVTVLDQAPVMLEQAAARLSRFGERADTAQGDLRGPEWRDSLSGPYDVAVSSIAIHNLGDPVRIKALYAEVYSVLAEGGCFFNLDYVRASESLVNELSRWAAGDPEGTWPGMPGRRRTGGGGNRDPRQGEQLRERGALEGQLSWLRAAGFTPAECFWKEFDTVLVGGFKGAVRVPEER